MTARPIPFELLTDSVTLIVPSEHGFSETEISNVRVVSGSKVREYSAVIIRDESWVTVYYDCNNSLPRNVAFIAGMMLSWNGGRYEITDAERFNAAAPHHVRLTAKRI